MKESSLTGELLKEFRGWNVRYTGINRETLWIWKWKMATDSEMSATMKRCIYFIYNKEEADLVVTKNVGRRAKNVLVQKVGIWRAGKTSLYAERQYSSRKLQNWAFYSFKYNPSLSYAPNPYRVGSYNELKPVFSQKLWKSAMPKPLPRAAGRPVLDFGTQRRKKELQRKHLISFKKSCHHMATTRSVQASQIK